VRLKSLILLTGFAFITSCENQVMFEIPQPEGQKNEKSIPKKIIGKYISESDSNIFLTISDEFIVQFSEGDEVSHISELDSVERASLKHDSTFFIVEINLKSHVSIRDDSVYQHWRYADTLFDFSDGGVLRKFKGYYFLNSEVEPNNWRVVKLGIVRSGLLVGKITSRKDVDNLRELTNKKDDTVYSFNPTRRQFKKFVKDEGFRNEERFKQIK